MPESTEQSIRAMRTLCAEIESAVAQGGISAPDVADLKSAIDDTRMRVWASMNAAASGEPGWVQEFWVHRAAEVCLTMARHLDDGTIDPKSQKAVELRAVTERIAAALSPPPRSAQ